MKDTVFGCTLSTIAIWALTYEQLNKFLTIFIAVFTAIWVVFKAALALIQFLEKIKEKKWFQK